VIAHEELLDYEAAAFPPTHADQKGIGTRASRQAGSLSVEKKPPERIGNLGAGVRPQQSGRVWSDGAHYRRTESPDHGQMLTSGSTAEFGAQQSSQARTSVFHKIVILDSRLSGARA